MAAVLGAYRGPADLDQLFSYTAKAVRNGASKVHRRHARKESHLAAMPTHERNDLVGTDQEVALRSTPTSRIPRTWSCGAKTSRRPVSGLRSFPSSSARSSSLAPSGYGNREIAAIVGLSERAVRKRVTRARGQLGEQPNRGA